MQDRFKFRYVFAKDFGGKTGICYKMPIFNLDTITDENFNKIVKSYIDYDYKLISIEQSTGLRDKHGKLIYEGDLLRYPPKDKDEKTNFVVCEVFFHNNDCCDTHIGFQMNRFRFQGNLCGIINYGMKYNFIPKNVEKMEVIGNKFQNKELLLGKVG